MKETMLQFFQWYTRADGFQYTRLRRWAPKLGQLGYTMIWLPPAYKGASGKKDNGYAPYDLYDIGEFNQKGSIRTKYGNVKQYKAAIDACHKASIQVIADIVFNHRMGADEEEVVLVRNVDPQNRTVFLTAPYPTKLYTRFLFANRKGKYSPLIWDASYFKATDRNQKNQYQILLFEGKKWDEKVSKEQGNFDFIMGLDVDTLNPKVKDALETWGIWYTNRFTLDGYRLDAIKSIDATFFTEWLSTMHAKTTVGPFSVGEYWSASLEELKGYLAACNYCMRLFDVPLHYNLHNASCSSGNYDVRTLFNGTLSQAMPDYAVAFVDNHDTQPTQALESWVMDWFKTSAYALILLGECQVPCVFLGDVQGISKTKNPPVPLLNEMVWIRNHLLEGPYANLCDQDPQKCCWMMLGPHPVLVLFTIGGPKTRTVRFPQYAGCSFVDITRENQIVHLDEKGIGTFDCLGGCCSIYLLPQDAKRMEKALGHRWF